MSDPVDHVQAGARPRPIRRLKRRWIAGALLAAPILVAAGLWIGLPQTRPMLSAAASQGVALGGGAIKSAASRFAGDAAAAKPDAVRGVRVMTVKLAEQRSEKRFTGVVAARYETQVGFRVAGKIAARQVEVGQSVRRGDTLMTLDAADYQAALRAADANQASALAQKVQADAELLRQRQLLGQGWTTRATFDRIVASASSAAEQVKAASEQVELARNTLSYATLTAPEDGIVTAIRAEAGQVVGQGQAVLTIVRNGEREAVIAIPEGQIGDLASWSARASFWSRGEASGSAILREVSPQADPASRTHAARFTLPGDAAKADLGATVTLTLTRITGEPAATLPSSAVFFQNSKPIVWRATPSGDRLEALPVSVVRLGAERTVVAGISDGDRIVTLGVHRLDAGSRVRIVEDVSLAGAQR